MDTKHKPSAAMIGLAAITLILSSFGLFRFAVDFGHVPGGLAWLAVAGFDLTALAAGQHALTVARDGDSSAPWNLLVIVAALLSAYIQFAHTQLAHEPVAVGVMFAAFPLATVCLYEGTLRRVHRLAGRAAGRVAPPRATFELLQWVLFRRQTMAGFKAAVLDRTLGSQGAFAIGATIVERTTRLAPEPERRTVSLPWGQVLPGFPDAPSGSPAVESGPIAEEPQQDGPHLVTDSGSVSALVRVAIAIHGNDDDAVFRTVAHSRPDVKPESISRTIRTVRSKTA